LVNFPTDDGVSTIVVDGLAVGDLCWAALGDQEYSVRIKAVNPADFRAI
jgi:hypothetical protein